ncbi:MAG: hypothetical protein ABIH68_01690, partial [bacterium]
MKNFMKGIFVLVLVCSLSYAAVQLSVVSGTITLPAANGGAGLKDGQLLCVMLSTVPYEPMHKLDILSPTFSNDGSGNGLYNYTIPDVESGNYSLSAILFQSGSASNPQKTDFRGESASNPFEVIEGPNNYDVALNSPLVGGSSIEVQTFEYSGESTGTVHLCLYTDTNFEGVPYDSFSDINEGGSFGAPTRTFLNIMDNMIYGIMAFRDINGNGVYDDGAEPFGMYESAGTAIEIQVGNAENKIVNSFIMEDSSGTTGSISGTIDYIGTQTGDLHIVIGHGPPDTWGMANLPVFNVQFTTGFPYSYNAGNIEAASDYYIWSYIDSDENSEHDNTTEAWGISPDAVTVYEGMATPDIDFNLSDPGSGSGVTLTLDGDGYDFSVESPEAWGAGADILFSSGTFAAGVLELEVYNGDIYDAGTAWSDVNSVDTFSNTGTGDGHIEPQVGHYYTFKDSVDNKETVIKITNITANSVTFVFNYDYMAGGGPIGGFAGSIGYLGEQTGGLLILVKESSAADWQSPSTYTYIASVTQADFPISYSYTGLTPEIEYDVCAVISADIVFDEGEAFGGLTKVWFSDGAILYNFNFNISDTGGTLLDEGGSTGTTDYDYYSSAGNGIPVSFGNITLTSSGGDAEISPNGDNIDDEFTINYVLVSTDSLIMTSGGANVKIVVDTNGNDIADIFKWEQVMWEDNAPHYVPASAIPVGSAYYNVSGNDWWGYFNSLDQDGKDAIKLSYEELNAQQAQMDYDFWDWISQSDFSLIDGVYKTGVRTVNVNFSWDWLKRIPTNGDCKVFIQAAAPYFAPDTLALGDSVISTITVVGVGVIRGTVTIVGGAPA